MKKGLKITLIILGVLVGFILLDTIQALVFNNNPIIGVETKCMRKEGILVNTYHCGNGNNITKLSLFNSSCDSISVCANNLNKDVKFTIVDKSKEIEHFACDTALDPFYEDKNYIYSYGCIMSDYIVVKYDNNKEETVKDALKNNHIKISDLDKFGISYIKQEK